MGVMLLFANVVYDSALTNGSNNKYMGGYEKMRNEIIKRTRVVDTFAARNLQMPESRSMGKDMGRYSLDLGFGLELRRRRLKRERL